ncbi:hypothetical protein IIB34_07900 [PVC group bacterium]|nr:hypothetical protein [PVC group bacterium]
MTLVHKKPLAINKGGLYEGLAMGGEINQKTHRVGFCMGEDQCVFV